MPTLRARPVRLTASARNRLKTIARGHKTAHRDRLRAQIVLDAARGRPNARIARERHLDEDTVRKWRDRFARSGLDGLVDLARSGRPSRFTAVQVAEVKALACQLPAESDTPLARWSHAELAREAVARGIVEKISASTVRRWLVADAIKPWQYRSWIFPRDPDFATKAARVLDLYQRVVGGVPLGPHDYVISADEKSQLQALRRCHPELGTAAGRTRRVEFEYDRGGTLAYFGAYDVHLARLFGKVADKTGIVPFMELVEEVMTSEPYRSAANVYWVVDNGSSHNGQRSIERMAAAFPHAKLVHLPVHASWLNQIEIVFSVIQRKVIKPADFADLSALADRLMCFTTRYNATATPLTGALPPRTWPPSWSGLTRTGRPMRRCSPPDAPAVKMGA